MANVAIVGAGFMGTATAWPLSDNGHNVRLVGTHLDAEIIASCKEQHYHPRLKRELPRGVKSFFVEEIAEGLRDVEIIVSGVNSLGAHWIGKTLAPHLRPGQMIIAITKGLEANAHGHLTILPDVLASELPATIRDQVKYAAIGGPCIAGELAGRRQSCVVFGSRDRAAVEQLARAFRTAYYHVWATTDLAGLEYSAALKNAYTLGVGLAYGLLNKSGGPDAANANMHNAAAALFAQGCTEIERLLRAAGASTFWAYSLPVAGDLFVTSAGGRTMRLGTLLGQGYTYAQAREIMAGETLESVEIVRAMSRALPKMFERGSVKPDDLPLLRALIDIVVHGKPASLPFDQFFGNLRDA
ncbi:MAG: glycerol-3-phosphate dehydrogenase [Chloroflexota bacterium]